MNHEFDRQQKPNPGERTRHNEVGVKLIDAADETIPILLPLNSRIVASQQRQARFVIGDDSTHSYKSWYPAFNQQKHDALRYVPFIGEFRRRPEHLASTGKIAAFEAVGLQ